MASPADLFGLMPVDQIDRLVLDLERQGVYPHEIEIRTPVLGRYRLHDEELHREAHGALMGGLLGMLIGVVGGMLALVAIDGLAGAGAVLWTLMGAGGFGLLIGGMSGLELRDRSDDDPELFLDVDDAGALQLVAVHSEHWRNRAHRILERHGATFIETADPV